jgi:hypothetical protein
LKQQVGEQLMQVQFPLSARQGSSEGASCQDILKDLQNPYYIGDQPGHTQTLAWVDAWATKPSVYVVAARNAKDIAAALDCAMCPDIRPQRLVNHLNAGEIWQVPDLLRQAAVSPIHNFLKGFGICGVRH